MRTKLLVLEILEGIFGWTWMLASLASVGFFISALFFHVTWNWLFLAIIVAVVSKGLLQGVIAGRHQVHANALAPSLSDNKGSGSGAAVETGILREALANELGALDMSPSDIELLKKLPEIEAVAWIKLRRVKLFNECSEIRKRLSALGKEMGNAGLESNDATLIRATEMKTLLARWQQLNPETNTGGK